MCHSEDLPLFHYVNGRKQTSLLFVNIVYPLEAILRYSHCGAHHLTLYFNVCWYKFSKKDIASFNTKAKKLSQAPQYKTATWIKLICIIEVGFNEKAVIISAI